MGHKTSTFADIIELGANEAAKKDKPFHYAELARTLVSTKRISYDSSVQSVVNKSHAIPLEEILGQLDRIKLPFHKLWIEQAASGPGIVVPPGTGITCSGFLVRSEKDSGSFSFQSYQSTAYAEGKEQRTGIDTLGLYRQLKDNSLEKIGFPETLFLGNRIVWQSTSTWITVSTQNGIQFEDEKLISDIEKASEHHKRKNPKHKPEDLINALYGVADDLARIFTLLGSNFVGEKQVLTKTPADEEAETYDRLRLKKGRAPLVPVTPITIDLSQKAIAILDRAEPKEVRQLLGWTSVRRTHVVNKYGTEFWRKEHDRRIVAEVDRRNVGRQLTNSRDTLRLELQAGKPVRTIEQPGNH